MIPYKVTGGRTDVPYVTVFILLLSAGLFLFQILQPSFDSAVYILTVVPPLFSLFDAKDWLNVGASFFVYESFVHLIVGLWFLWVFGSWVEKQFGHVLYFCIFLLSGTVSVLLEWQNEPSSRLAIIASSAAISGVMGTYLALCVSSTVSAIGLQKRVPASIQTGGWLWPVVWIFLQCVNNGFYVETINYEMNWSSILFDLAGFTTGLVLGMVLRAPLKRFYTWFDALD